MNSTIIPNAKELVNEAEEVNRIRFEEFRLKVIKAIRISAERGDKSAWISITIPYGVMRYGEKKLFEELEDKGYEVNYNNKMLIISWNE